MSDAPPCRPSAGNHADHASIPGGDCCPVTRVFNPCRACIVVTVLILCVVAGCQDELGTGGTGELVVPRRQLQEIESLDLRRSVAATQPATLPATMPAGPEVTLSIEECRRLALQNNLDLRVTLFTPTISRQSLTAAEAQFEAVFFTNLTASSAHPAVAPGKAGPLVQQVVPDAGLQIPLRTGGSVRLDLSTPVLHEQVPGFKNEWTPEPSIGITQPLLQGAGLYVNTQGIRIAFYESQRAMAQTKLVVIRVLADVDRAYWRLWAARQAERVRKTAYDSAVAQLDRARRQARAGTVAEVDVVRAQSGVADTVESVITAENDIRQAQRDLKRMLNDPTLPLTAETTILTSTEPAVFPYDVDPERLTAAALRQRMEMLDIELQIAENAANVRVAQNSLLPILALSYTYGVQGLGITAGQAFNQVWVKNADSHQLGLQFQIPIGNEAARARLRQAMLARMQTLATKEQQALSIRQDIANAVDTLQTDWQRILAAQERTVLAARTLDVEVRQFNLGLRTSTDVLIAQSDLANAQQAEVAAVSDYQIAQVDIAFATGTLLGAAHVDWQRASEPNVPRY
jgi:outer membrane protein